MDSEPNLAFIAWKSGTAQTKKWTLMTSAVLIQALKLWHEAPQWAGASTHGGKGSNCFQSEL